MVSHNTVAQTHTDIPQVSLTGTHTEAESRIKKGYKEGCFTVSASFHPDMKNIT